MPDNRRFLHEKNIEKEDNKGRDSGRTAHFIDIKHFNTVQTGVDSWPDNKVLSQNTLANVFSWLSLPWFTDSHIKTEMRQIF